MRLLFLFVLSFFFVSHSSAQSGDFIIVKKKNKTVATYFSGNHIEFTSTGGAYRNALINKFENDSIFLQEFVVHRLLTTYGGFILDTVGSFRYKYHYLQIHSFGPPQQKKFSISGSGASLIGGSILLVLGSGIVYVTNREKFSSGLLIAGAAAGVLGYTLSKAGAKPMVMGKKKYHIVYMGSTTKN